MTTMARHHHHVSAGGVNLVHLATGVVNAFVVETSHQSTAPTAAADLIDRCGIQIDPIFHALA